MHLNYVKKKILPFSILFLAIKMTSSMAAGMVPETSLLLVDEADKSSSIDIKNTDSHPSLLYTNVVDLPDDKGTHLIVTQPVTRVEPGQTQQLRFILQTDAPLTVEHLKRVTFEGIPPKQTGKGIHQVSINIRQDIPVLIHPKSLPIVKDAWTLLKWSVAGDTVTVKNDSPYVVRMAQQASVLPSNDSIKFSKTYLLPGESLSAKAKNSLNADKQIKFYPASRYGVQVSSYTTNLTPAAAVNTH